MILLPTLLGYAMAIHAKFDIPTLWIVGDSSVHTGGGAEKQGQWGWGESLPAMFDASKIRVQNRPLGARSSRTFITDGQWSLVTAELKQGDFVILQFGHNDAGPVNDGIRARGTIRGIGSEMEEIDNQLTKKHETVYTFGWYLRKYIQDVKAHGATAIVLSDVPRCPKPATEIKPNPKMTSYRLWSKQVADEQSAYFIDLYGLIWSAYVGHSPEAVRAQYYTTADFIHTNREGADLNAHKVVEGIRGLSDCSLRDYLMP